MAFSRGSRAMGTAPHTGDLSDHCASGNGCAPRFSARLCHVGSLEITTRCTLQPAADSESLLQKRMAGILLLFPSNRVRGQVPLLTRTFSLVILCPPIKGAVAESPSPRILTHVSWRSLVGPCWDWNEHAYFTHFRGCSLSITAPGTVLAVGPG